MASEYREEVKEAVSANAEYLESGQVEDFITFLEGVGESLYDGEIIEQVASAIRDQIDGL